MSESGTQPSKTQQPAQPRPDAPEGTPSNQPPAPPSPPGASEQVDSPVSRAADNLVLWIARHWLALFNSAWGLYLLLPFFAPILLQGGFTTPANLIYTVYSYACHQLPGHSYFLFGDSFVPSMAALEAAGMPSGPNLFTQRAFVGNESVGFKIALCQRDIAIYAAIALGGLLFAGLRNRLSSPTIRLYLLFLIPIALDGGTQLFGLRESNWWLRTLTGALFGAATVWLVYPYVQAAMEEVIETEESRRAARTH